MKILQKLLKLLLIGGMVMLLFSPSGFSFDKSSLTPLPSLPEFTKEYVNLSDVITQIHVFGTAEGLYPSIKDGKTVAVRGVGVFEQGGSCFYMGYHGGRHLFITNAHVVTPGQVVIQETKDVNWITKPIRVISKVITIGQGTKMGSAPAEVLYVDAMQDLAVVGLIGNWPTLGKQPYEAAWTLSGGEDLLKEGDLVCTIVATRPNKEEGDFSKGPWFEVRWGKIVKPYPYLPGNALVPPGFIAWFQPGDVTSDLVIYPGDSGSPVIAFTNGKPNIIGVVRAYGLFQVDDDNVQYYYSYFSRIDSVIPFFLEK